MAKRVRHDEAYRFPPPARETLMRMALSMYATFADQLEAGSDLELAEWGETSELVRECWVASARAAYVVLAVTGGAVVEDIGEDIE